jgi:hypothetical protein
LFARAIKIEEALEFLHASGKDHQFDDLFFKYAIRVWFYFMIRAFIVEVSPKE